MHLILCDENKKIYTFKDLQKFYLLKTCTYNMGLKSFIIQNAQRLKKG